MYAMQYAIGLPADYDMTIIHARVAAKGSLFDRFPGLGLKAFLLRERGVRGSAVNEYAPFYVWRSIAGMNRFLWGGGGFGGIVASFGRPPIRHWTGVGFVLGPAGSEVPRFARLERERLPLDLDPQPEIERMRCELRDRARLVSLHSAVLAVDPWIWEAIRFTLSLEDTGEGIGYKVLHLCTPEMNRIAVMTA